MSAITFACNVPEVIEDTFIKLMIFEYLQSWNQIYAYTEDALGIEVYMITPSHSYIANMIWLHRGIYASWYLLHRDIFSSKKLSQ